MIIKRSQKDPTFNLDRCFSQLFVESYLIELMAIFSKEILQF